MLNADYEWLYQEYVVKQISKEEMAASIGCHPNSISRLLRKNNIPRRGVLKRRINLKDRKFGRLTVEKYVRGGRQGSVWSCRCDCGNVIDVVSNSLRKGLSTSCGCYRRELMFKGHSRLSGSYWNRVIKAAKTRSLEVRITIAQAWEVFLRQDGKCALTGVPIVIVRDYTRNHCQHTASLDRKNSSLGYTIDNVQWVHRDVNRLKNSFSEEYLLRLSRMLLEYHGYTVSPGIRDDGAFPA